MSSGGSTHDNDGYRGYHWTSALTTSSYKSFSTYMFLHSSEVSIKDSINRDYGLSIRPVANPKPW